MLRKRTRSHQKDQNMNNLIADSTWESYFQSDMSNEKHKVNSFLKVPGLFVGLNPRNSESDSVRSPTSPLDFRIFTSLGNPFRCVRAQNEGQAQHKSWDCSKVGLSIIDSLDGEANEIGRASDNKNIIFGRQMSVICSHASSLEAPKSLPENVAIFGKPSNARRSVVFEIGDGRVRARSVDSGRYGSQLMEFGNRKSRFGSGNLVHESTAIPVRSGPGTSPNKLDSSSGEKLSWIHFPPIPIELSEDYTCVTTHGPNPRVTHIFGDCILECHNNDLTNFLKKRGHCDALPSYPPSEDFLKFCYSCHKKLDGEDIYMYRGEKAFCSSTCRSQEMEMEMEMEIEIEEEVEKTNICEETCISSGLFV